MPFAFVNSQFEPLRLVRSVAPYRTRIVVEPPAGRTPPSGTTIVWSLTVALTATPSTVTGSRRIAPSRAAIVFSSIRSTGPPEVFEIDSVASTRIRCAAQFSFSRATYVAVRCTLERFAVPATMSPTPTGDAPCAAGTAGEGRPAATIASTNAATRRWP